MNNAAWTSCLDFMQLCFNLEDVRVYGPDLACSFVEQCPVIFGTPCVKMLCSVHLCTLSIDFGAQMKSWGHIHKEALLVTKFEENPLNDDVF